MKRATASILFLLLFNPSVVERAAGESAPTSDAIERQAERSTPTSKQSDDAMMRRIEGQVQQLRESGQAVRDKRALGILLQGFLESLGYTVSPIQLASLPNSASAAPTPAAAGQSTPATSAKPAAARVPAPARQRETLRFTGLLNFGSGQNASGLTTRLTQYEQLFHGNKSVSNTVAPDVDPRRAPEAPQDQPHLVKLPMPAGMPTVPPATMPADHVQSNRFSSEDSSEESYSGADELSDEEQQQERELCQSEETDDSAEQAEPQSQRLHEDEANDESEQSGEGIMRFSLAEQEARAEALAEEQLERQLQRQQQAEHADEEQDDEAPTARLPISCADEHTGNKTPRDPVLRDSYGQRLPETGGVADYVRMFKAPRNGVFEQQRARESFEQLDGSNRIPGPPGSRYEEYEIDAADRHTDKKEHRAKGSSCRCAEASEQRTPYSAREQSSDRGIIQRLTSHDKQPAPERIGAWPTAFDYLYDDSEHEGPVHGASSPAPLAASRPPGEDKLKMIFRHRSAESYRSEQPPARTRGFRESSSAQPIREGAKLHFPMSGSAAAEQKNRPPKKEGRSDYQAANDKSASRPSDVTTARPDGGLSTKSPKAGEQAPRALSMTEHRQSSARPTIKVKYTRPLASSRGDVLEETANYVEKDARLVVPGPTPYYFNEGFQGFTDEPAQINTQRVQIKRYRNHVASVKVSDLKHPQPRSSMQIFKYTRKL